MLFPRLVVVDDASSAADVAAPFDVTTLQSAIDAPAGGVTRFSIPGNLAVLTADGNDVVGITGQVAGLVAVDLGAAVCSFDSARVTTASRCGPCVPSPPSSTVVAVPTRFRRMPRREPATAARTSIGFRQ